MSSCHQGCKSQEEESPVRDFRDTVIAVALRGGGCIQRILREYRQLAILGRTKCSVRIDRVSNFKFIGFQKVDHKKAQLWLGGLPVPQLHYKPHLSLLLLDRAADIYSVLLLFLLPSSVSFGGDHVPQNYSEQ